MGFFKRHKVLTGFLIVFLILGVLIACRRAYVVKQRAEQAKEQEQISETDEAVEVDLPSKPPTVETPSELEPAPSEETSEPESSYKSSLKQRTVIKRDESKVREQKKKEEEERKRKEEEEKNKKLVPNIEVSCKVFAQTQVPNVNVDGSSCKAYQSGVSLEDFGSFWGTKLGDDDKKSKTKILVGVSQDNIDAELEDLQSVGWLINKVGVLSQDTAIKFTNLHVIGSLATDHVAVLCSYDWYSAYGLKDTLVVFEDISGTLKPEDFNDGAVFSATAFIHNMKVETVNGQDVLCVEYADYEK